MTTNCCDICEYTIINQGRPGHCYMFEKEPPACAQFKLMKQRKGVETKVNLTQLIATLLTLNH